MSDITYEPGIYRDIDGDVIKVDITGTPSIIGVGHDGVPLISMSAATKIADLPRWERPVPTVTVAEPTLEDGVYRDTEDGDVVLVEDGKVVEVLDAGDFCSTESHLPYYQDTDPAELALVRLVAPERDASLPTDGFYADKEGDLLQVKGDQMRYLNWHGEVGGWTDLSDDYPAYGPYTSLVEATAK